MPTNLTDSATETIDGIIRETSEIELVSRFGHLDNDEIMKKGHCDVVTVADLASEKRLTSAIEREFPGAAVIGEEGAEQDPGIIEHIYRGDDVWVVDPLDGTRNFSEGNPKFAVIVAHISGGITRAGWIYSPMDKTMVHATLGNGAWCGGERLRLPDITEPALMTACVGKKLAGHMAMVPDAPKKYVRYRCAGHEYMELALGKIHFSHYAGKMYQWDHAAGALIYAEAGGAAFFSSLGHHPGSGLAPYIPGERPRGRHLVLGPDEKTLGEILGLLHFG